MVLTGKFSIDAPRNSVFAALTDINVLREAVPGCNQLKKNEYNEYSSILTLNFAQITSQFAITSHSDIVIPSDKISIIGEGNGGPAGNFQFSGTFDFSTQPATTSVSYTLKLRLKGKIAKLEEKSLNQTIERISEDFSRNIKKIIEPTPEKPSKINAFVALLRRITSAR